VIVAILLVGVAAALRLRRMRVTTPTQYLWLLAVAAVFLGYTIELWRAPEEALHFVEYGVLGVLIYRALLHRLRDPGLYLVAALIGGIIGTLDEAIQWITPRRVWDLRDIRLNFVAGVLVQLGLALGVRPPIVSGWPGRRSLRWSAGLAALGLALLGASLLNTPPRIAWYAQRVPGLDFLLEQDGVMFEYGYLYDDPEIGRYRSRFTAAELRPLDSERAEAAAAILDRFPDRDSYGEFLKKYTPINAPFVHEARVHLFRRDLFLGTAEKYRDRERDYRFHLWVGYRENQILEKHFGRTLALSSHVLPPERIEHMRQHLLKSRYESPVSRGLETRFTERQVAAALGLAIVAALAIAAALGREPAGRRDATAAPRSR
jgi:hypothetical protein